MSYIETWFDPVDYISEISTEALCRELKRRGHDLGEKTVELIKADLEDAWEHSDEILFRRVVRMIENPEKEQQRMARLSAEYKAFLSRKQQHL